jgi:membrane glycosyltransferase
MSSATRAAVWTDTFPPIARAPMTPRPWLGVARGFVRALQPRSTGGRRRAAQPTPWAGAAQRRRQALALTVLAATALATLALLGGELRWPQDLPHALLVVLFALLFAWVTAGFVTALMGLRVALHGDRHALSPPDPGVPISQAARTAIIMPICNEDVGTVFAGLRATCRSLAATGALKLFDVYILSDTNDPALREAELQAWRNLREQLGDDGRVFYRLRRRRTKRKAGNVADFCRRWGSAYRYMVVLDADSVMSGDCLVSMVRLMEQNPQAGIIQTAPRACGHDTLHARAQQFASRVSGRLFAMGLAYWQLGESHYWGHNAILRVAPFMKHCALAKLPGNGGLGGEILSHDFVEAALMRRAGWEVWLAPELDGSYEQQPPNLLEELQRDRRWCQGNLQNARLIAEPGFKSVHRAMFATGAMSYLASPLWLGFVVLGVVHALGGDAPTGALPGAAWLLSALTLSMLLMPRALGVVLVVLRGEQRHYGGGLRLAAGALFEAFLSVLQAPIRMLAHSLFVLVALTGWKLDWKSPARDDSALHWRDAARSLGGAGALALAALWAIAVSGHDALAWRIAPLLLPLALAVPLVVWSSRSTVGRVLRHVGLLLTPEEVATPGLLKAAVPPRPRLATPATPSAVPTPAAAPIVLPTPVAPLALAPAHAARAVRPRVRRAPWRLAPALRAAAACAGLAVPVTTPWVPNALATAAAPPVHHWAAAAPAVAESLLPAPTGWPPFERPLAEVPRVTPDGVERTTVKARARRPAHRS